MKSLVNFRDLGGVKAEDGRTVKLKRLLRSGEIVGVDECDIEKLKDEYDLRYIIDLRSEGEAERAPDHEIDGVEYVNISLYKPDDADRKAQTAEEKEFRKLTDPKKVEIFMTGVYENLVTNPFSLDGFSRFVKLVRDNREGSIIFHCFAGKDRTGIAAAILYTILGVKQEDIMGDYMLTNELRRERNNIVLAKAREEGKSEEHLKALAVSYEVRDAYLEKVFEITNAKSGSFLAYIKEYMDVSDSDIEAIRNNYLE